MEQAAQLGEEKLPVFVHLQDLQEDTVVDRYLTHSLFFQEAFDGVKTGIEQSVIQVLDKAFPLAAGHPVNHSVPDVAVSEIHFHGEPVQETVDIDFLLQICQIIRIAGRITVFDPAAHAGKSIFHFSRYLHRTAADVQDGYVIRLVIRNLLITADGIGIHAFTHVVDAPVFTVQVYVHRFPGLGQQVRVRMPVDQPVLYFVQYAGPHTVTAAVPEQDGGIGGGGAVIKERVIKGSVQRFDKQAFLRHIHGIHVFGVKLQADVIREQE